MQMDLFYETLPQHLHATRKRIHFHAFMLDVFQRLHEIKHGLPPASSPGQGSSATTTENSIRKPWLQKVNPMKGKSATGKVGVEALSGGALFKGVFSRFGQGGAIMDDEDAIYEVAREFAREGRVLCFDEVYLVQSKEQAS